MRAENIVIGTSWVAEVLYLRTKLLTEQLPPVEGQPPVPEMSITVAREIVWETTDQLLRMRAAWLPRQHHDWSAIDALCHEACTTGTAELVIPQLTGNNSPQPVHEIMYSDIMIPMCDEIDVRLLTPYIGDGNSWCMYSLVRLPNGDSLIRNDGDYRIWDWERQQQEIRQLQKEYKILEDKQRNGLGL